MIQRLWRGRIQRLKYRAVLQAARTIQTYWITRIRPVQQARWGHPTWFMLANPCSQPWLGLCVLGSSACICYICLPMPSLNTSPAQCPLPDDVPYSFIPAFSADSGQLDIPPPLLPVLLNCEMMLIRTAQANPSQ